MLYNQPGPTVEECFLTAYKKSLTGDNSYWHRTLVLSGLIDAEKSTKSKTVCTRPSSNVSYEEIKQKIEWLRPFSKSSPLVETVINKIDASLNNWEQHTKKNNQST